MSGPSRAWQPAARGLFLIGLVAALSGCLYYDSRWGQAKASQKRVAAHAMPSQLLGQGPGAQVGGHEPAKPTARLTLRAYATPHYAAALVDGEAQFVQALGDANPTLARDLSIRIELSEYRVWSNGVSDDDLSTLIDAIAKEDAAEDVDWVLVLASPRHMVAVESDQLGVGKLVGRYLAIRAMSDADEFDVIERAFTELSEDEKAKLYAARKRHKAATVLLHELGHTLGMPHELEKHSMMSARYDTGATGFSSQAARLGQRVLSLRATTPGTELHRNAALAALNVLNAAPEHSFEPGTARQVNELLQFEARRPSAVTPLRRTLPPAAVTPPPSKPKTAVGSTLSSTDRGLLAKAREAQAAGRIAEARTIATPLFEAYPNDYAVQELRCQLAMKAGLAIADEQSECQPLMRLSGSPF